MPYELTKTLEFWSNPMGAAFIMAIMVIVLVRSSRPGVVPVDPVSEQSALSIGAIAKAWLATVGVTLVRYLITEIYLAGSYNIYEMGVTRFGPSGGILGLVLTPVVAVALASTVFRRSMGHLGLTFRAIIISVLLPFAISAIVFPIEFILGEVAPWIWLFAGNSQRVSFGWPFF